MTNAWKDCPICRGEGITADDPDNSTFRYGTTDPASSHPHVSPEPCETCAAHFVAINKERLDAAMTMWDMIDSHPAFTRETDEWAMRSRLDMFLYAKVGRRVRSHDTALKREIGIHLALV